MEPNSDHKIVIEKNELGLVVACCTTDIGTTNELEIKTFQEKLVEENLKSEFVQNDSLTILQLKPTKVMNFMELMDLMQKELTCFMCDEIMRKPCVCPTCGNLVGCKECLAQSHVSLNEFRDSNDYEPVEPMCPYCRESSYPFRPVEFKAMQEVAAQLRQWSLRDD